MGQRLRAAVVIRYHRRGDRARQVEIDRGHACLLAQGGNFVRIGCPCGHHPVNLPGEHRFYRFDLQLRPPARTGDNRQQAARSGHLLKALRHRPEIAVIVFGDNHTDDARFFAAQHAGLAVNRIALLLGNPRHLFGKLRADAALFPVAVEDSAHRARRNAGQFSQVVNRDFLHFPNLRHKIISLLISPLAQSMKLAQHELHRLSFHFTSRSINAFSVNTPANIKEMTLIFNTLTSFRLQRRTRCPLVR